MNRNDIHGNTLAPKAAADYLLRKGGKNLYGEPVFRLVHAPSRRIQKGGKFNDWDDNIVAHERGGIVRLQSGLLISNGHVPRQTVIEVRSVPKYPGLGDGWAIERWMPLGFYGARAAWEQRVVPGTTVPLLGPYPAQGDYELCGFWGHVPSISEMQDKIDRCEYARELHSGSVESMILERVHRFESEAEAQQAKEEAETQARIADLLKPLWSSSLTAGVLRNQLAAAAGIREHVGN